ncbi:hypothetical protein SPI_09377 [Niveomyces insectorum RCEF 264]|uniref:Prion-inhibition and propagation HeLo domain-containing protein n=1 Tax=Niveomyces insectorum RCEF 264 TaxID=1081102 RepID=A0A167LSK0_9HYPO|nr:hypothetical protein SPI_09377 [Niveomyces insectorum RCEF 264]
MAELAGLVIGGVSLITLFQSCSDACAKIELAVRYGRDYEHLVVQFDLVRTRLFLWGQTLGLDPASSSPEDAADATEAQDALCAHWDSVHTTIGNALVAIRELVGDQRKLEKIYDLKRLPPPPTANRAAPLPSATVDGPLHDDMDMVSTPSSSWTAPRTALDELQAAFRVRARRRQSQGSLALKSLWAIRGRNKFAALIRDLSFWVVHLEKVSEQLGVLHRQRALFQARLQAVHSPESVLLLDAAIKWPGGGQPRQRPQNHGHGPENVSHTGSRAAPEYIRSTVHDRARQINGDVGLPPGGGGQAGFARYVDATARDDATQINGNISMDAFRSFMGR